MDSLLHSIILSPEDGIGELERRVARDLEILNLPAANWPANVQTPDGNAVTDVVVVGAGMNGIAAAAALIFKGVRNIRILERASPGNEGPWLTFARMDTLRSPKTLPGPALGIPSLSFRSWFEAAFGIEAWESLYKIENAVWVDYLGWLQRVLKLPVEHGVAVKSIAPAGGVLKVTTTSGRGENTFHARRIVLATGRGGAGGDKIPNFIDAALWPDLAAHTNEPIDFAALQGRSIGIVGGGASAWDNAATALEKGAGRVDMYVRRHSLPQINKGRGSASPGYFHGWSALDDAERWALFVYLNDVQAPPPHETVRRALRQPAFHIHLGKPVERAVRVDGRAVVNINGEDMPRAHDFLIVGTGFDVNTGDIPEISSLAPFAARWLDRYDPPEPLRRRELGHFPYLGEGFELLERQPGQCPEISRIYLVNHGAALSHGAVASDIPGVNVAAERVSTAIVKNLFAEDIGAIRDALEAFDEPELQDTPFFVPR